MKKSNFNELAVAFKYSKTEKNYSALYQALRRPLLKHINTFIKDPEVANDVWQDTAIKVYEKIDMYNENFSFSTWIYTIARNECFIFMKSKSQKNRVSLSNADENGIEITSNMEVTLINNVDIDAVDFIEFDRDVEDIDSKYSETMDMISDLDPMYKDFLIDKYVHNLKEKQISAKYDVTKNTVKNRLFHGRKQIQKKFADKNVRVY